MRRLLPVLLFFLIVLFVWPLWATAAVPASPNDRVLGQVLVKFKPDTSQNTIDNELKRHGAKVTDQVAAIGVLVLAVPQNAESRIITALLRNPNVEFAEADYLAFATVAPNDTHFTNQWGLENTGQIIKGQAGTEGADISALAAWNTTTGINIKVAILDTGIDQDHEDLSDKIINKVNDQKNFTTSSTIDDLYGHGTHVGGIVAAVTNNGMGVSGGCPDCALMNGKVLRDDGAGYYSWIANGIIWSADNGARVINMSLGGSSPSRTLESAVNYAWNKGVVLTGAAGNSGNQSKTYPGAYKNVIAVAATNNKDKKASFSSYGAKWVDVAAPGQDIFSTFPNHPYKINKSANYDYGSGTSMATPMVSAVAALVWSTPYGTSNLAVRARVESTSDKIPGTGTYWSAGRVNAAAAVTP